MPNKSHQEFKVNGDELLKKIKALIHEGNVRRIIIKNSKGQSFLEIPVTVGLIGAVVAPIMVAIGAIAAMANNFTLEVVMQETPDAKAKSKTHKKK